jgi:LPXTG-site transpeptidase (sortase) family protein
LTAHVWDAYNQPGPFADIKNLRFGDQFEINSLGKNYIYEVRENKLIRADHVDEMMQPEKEDWVTLVTCENYDAQTQEYSSRRLVRAVLIRYK